jgi:hypothetical protein
LSDQSKSSNLHMLRNIESKNCVWKYFNSITYRLNKRGFLCLLYSQINRIDYTSFRIQKSSNNCIMSIMSAYSDVGCRLKIMFKKLFSLTYIIERADRTQFII